jgi:hypothetical protein
VYHAAARARLAPAIPSVKARRPGMYMPATATPLTARQISAGIRPSLKAMPKQDSAFSALLARKIMRAGMRSVSATSGSTAAM